MSAQINEEVHANVSAPTADALFSADDGIALNVQVKQEKELIIVEQQENQLCSNQLIDERIPNQAQSPDFLCDGYSSKFLDHDDNVDYDSQDLDYINEDGIDQGEESDEYDYKYNDDMELDEPYDKQPDVEADYKYRKFTESYKKIVDLQNFNYIFILCPLCDLVSKTFSGWTRHLYSKHSDYGEELKTHYDKIVKGKAICKHCSQTVVSNVNHYLHYFTKHCPNPKSLFQCTICKHKVLTPPDIVKHLDDKHNQFNDLYRKCPLCGEVFKERKQMRYHFRDWHHNEYMEKFNYMCHLCKHPRFSKESNLYDHMINLHHLCGHDWESTHFKAIDADELKYECLKCHSTCHITGQYTLLKHHLKHEDNCWWYCKFCLDKIKFSETMHLCNKMYRHYLPHTSTSKGYRSQNTAAKEKQSTDDWQAFEDYIIHCCPFCSEEFQKFQEWQVHLREQHFINTLKGLKMSLVENDIRKLRCVECRSLVVTSFVDIYTHCFQHLPYKPYKCRHCLILMDSYQIALKHCLNKCKETNDTLYSTEDIIFRHKLANDASNSIIILCFVCKGKQFSTAEDIESHFKMHHKNFEEHFEKNNITKKMVCNVCKNTLDSVSSSVCLRHYVEHLGEGPFKCVFCQRSYITYERCRIHVNRYHNTNVSLISKNPKRLPRQKLPPKPQVPKGLGVSGEKATILNEFSEFMSYACPECDERFSTVATWGDHINSQHTFFQESSLSVIDSETSKNRCRECNITLCTSVSQRQRHKLTHMPNKAFVCTLCNTRTTTSGLLYSHLRRIHFFEGVYECPVCSVSLNNAYERSVHVIKTHPRSEWPENMCLICYRNYTHLRTHMLTHDTNRPKYNCPICNVAIIYIQDLQFHMKQKHNQVLGVDFKRERTRPCENGEPSPLKDDTCVSKKDDGSEELIVIRRSSRKRKASSAKEKPNKNDKTIKIDIVDK